MSSEDGVILYKRWRLRSGVTISDVRRFVEQEIVPRYTLLSPSVVLELEADADGLTVPRTADRHLDTGADTGQSGARDGDGR